MKKNRKLLSIGDVILVPDPTLREWSAVELLNSRDMIQCTRAVISQTQELYDHSQTIGKYQEQLTEKDAALVKSAEEKAALIVDRDQWKSKAKGRGDRTVVWILVGAIGGMVTATALQ